MRLAIIAIGFAASSLAFFHCRTLDGRIAPYCCPGVKDRTFTGECSELVPNWGHDHLDPQYARRVFFCPPALENEACCIFVNNKTRTWCDIGGGGELVKVKPKNVVLTSNGFEKKGRKQKSKVSQSHRRGLALDPEPMVLSDFDDSFGIKHSNEHQYAHAMMDRV